MDKPETISLYRFFQKFPDETAARLFFENNRWGGTKACPHCGSVSVVECKDHKPMPYRCRDCRKHFSVRTGTVLEESKLPLQKWLMAIYMMTTARKGIPSTQMARELGCTQKSAWFLAQRIREAWLSGSASDVGGGGKLGGTVEVDEAYIGGIEGNKHASKRSAKTTKAIVVGIKQRDGVVIAKRVPEATKDAIQSAAEQAIATFGSMKSTPLLEASDAKFNGLELVRGKDHKARIANLSSTLSRSARFESSPAGWIVVQKDKPPQTAKIEGV